MNRQNRYVHVLLFNVYVFKETCSQNILICVSLLIALRNNHRLQHNELYVLRQQPPRGIHNHIISGANLRTKSNVWFGEPPLGGAFYNTTNSGAFPAKSVPYSYNGANFHKESDIPLNYYGSKCGSLIPKG